MKVLLSIKPEYAEKILDGEKLFEFRKTIPKSPDIKIVIIYATLPVGKVIGEFEIDEFLSESPKKLWRLTQEYAGITKSFFNAYFDGRDMAHAIKVKKVRRYDKPLHLKDVVSNGVAPQSFRYIYPNI